MDHEEQMINYWREERGGYDSMKTTSKAMENRRKNKREVSQTTMDTGVRWRIQGGKVKRGS